MSEGGGGLFGGDFVRDSLKHVVFMFVIPISKVSMPNLLTKKHDIVA